MADLRPLSVLARDMIAAGYEPIPYRTAWTAAVNCRFPARRAANQRWYFNPADIPTIASAMGRKAVKPPQPQPSRLPEGEDEMETVSYHLPVDLIQLVRDLAEARLKVEREEKRQARREGRKPPQARRSASAIIREALESHQANIEAELAALTVAGAPDTPPQSEAA